MTKPLVRSWWRFRYYPLSVKWVWGWRNERHEAFDLGKFAYVPPKDKS